MQKILRKICYLCLIFMSISLSAGPLGGSRETAPGTNPFKLLQDFIEEKTEEAPIEKNSSATSEAEDYLKTQAIEKSYEDIQLDSVYFENVSDKLSEGDMVKVKVLEVDRQGRVRLSMKAVTEDE